MAYTFVSKETEISSKNVEGWAWTWNNFSINAGTDNIAPRADGKPHTDTHINSPFFYREDIVMILQQPGVNALMLCKAKFPRVAVDVLVLVGARYDYEAEQIDSVLDGSNPTEYLVALPCRPYNIQGGTYEKNP